MSRKGQLFYSGQSTLKRSQAKIWALVGSTALCVSIGCSQIEERTITSEAKVIEMHSSSETFQWPKPPEMAIDPGKLYTANIHTEMGDIVIRLFAKESPITVNNFVFLARQGYYDGVTFHRVIPGFMAQGGDRTGTGSGGPGYSFEDEVDNGLEFDREGLLAMANSGPSTNGSQFFITYDPTPHLNGAHTIFGEVVEGQEVLISLPARDPAGNTGPGTLIETILVEER